MPRVRTALAPVAQGGSGAATTGRCGGNVRWAALVNSGSIQQGGTMGWGKDHLNIAARPLTASCCNVNGSVAVLRAHVAARTSRDICTVCFQQACQCERLPLT
jgi:hypothetical protein